ncbi:MAG: efflux RND transporter periplasmic adaptor subunit [Acidobacteriota bacterium]|nr:efflux RND transporter periplasmic adaptor subunit [Acidobacteriota bacterium]
MKKTTPLIAVLALVFAVVAVIAMKPVRHAEPPPFTPPTPKSESSVGAVGLVEANTENINLSCAVSGLVTAVYAEAGDHIQAGQKLFSLDDRDLEADLAAKHAALATAKARLAKLEEEPRAEDIPPAEARVREAEASLGNAAVQLRLIESVHDKRAVREEDVETRKYAYKAAKAQLADAQSQLALLKAGAWAPDIAEAKSEVAQSEAQLKAVQINIERLTTRAPITGVILQKKVRVGQYAECGPVSEPLMILGSIAPLNIRVDVDEEDAWRVQAGAPAVGSPRGDGSLKIPLQFVRFEPYVIPKQSLTGDSTERVDTRVLQVIYRVEARNSRLHVGQQMDVYIKTPAQPSALLQGPDSAPGGGK